MKRIAVDWDGTCEFNYVKNEVIKWIEMGHYVEIVTTRYQDPTRYPCYREGIDDSTHKSLFKFAKRAGINVHFTNMEYKARYLTDNNFDYLVDDNPEEHDHLHLVKSKCEFMPENEVFSLTEILENASKENNI